MLFEDVAVADTDLPMEAFKAHLRLGTGFGQDDVQDEVLLSFFRAALSAIETRTGKALLARAFNWRLPTWSQPQGQQLPISPIVGISRIALVALDNSESDLDPTTYWLERDAQSPRIRPTGAHLPDPQMGGEVLVEFTAGIAATWVELPRDLQQAVMMLAAHYYEYRHDTGLAGGCMPFGVTSLIERFRILRLGRVGVS